jgi:hypothetical protein
MSELRDIWEREPSVPGFAKANSSHITRSCVSFTEGHSQYTRLEFDMEFCRDDLKRDKGQPHRIE